MAFMLFFTKAWTSPCSWLTLLLLQVPLMIINIPGFAGSDILCGGETLWPPAATGNAEKLQKMRLEPDGKTSMCAGAGPTMNPDDPEGFAAFVRSCQEG